MRKALLKFGKGKNPFPKYNKNVQYPIYRMELMYSKKGKIATDYDLNEEQQNAAKAYKIVNKRNLYLQQLEYEEYFCFTEVENMIIDYVLNFSKKKCFDFEKYIHFFCQNLNQIYAKNNKSWRFVHKYEQQNEIVLQFAFGLNENELPIETYNDKYEHFKGFDCVFIRKENNVNFWQPINGLTDAQEVFMELKNVGF